MQCFNVFRQRLYSGRMIALAASFPPQRSQVALEAVEIGRAGGSWAQTRLRDIQQQELYEDSSGRPVVKGQSERAQPAAAQAGTAAPDAAAANSPDSSTLAASQSANVRPEACCLLSNLAQALSCVHI